MNIEKLRLSILLPVEQNHLQNDWDAKENTKEEAQEKETVLLAQVRIQILKVGFKNLVNVFVSTD